MLMARMLTNKKQERADTHQSSAQAIARPTTATAGMMAAAIMTPMMVVDCSVVYPNAPTNPAIIAPRRREGGRCSWNGQ